MLVLLEHMRKAYHTVFYSLSLSLFLLAGRHKNSVILKMIDSIHCINWTIRITIKSLDGLIMVLSKWFLLFTREMTMNMLNRKERNLKAIKLIGSMSGCYGKIIMSRPLLFHK